MIRVGPAIRQSEFPVSVRPNPTRISGKPLNYNRIGDPAYFELPGSTLEMLFRIFPPWKYGLPKSISVIFFVLFCKSLYTQIIFYAQINLCFNVNKHKKIVLKS